MLLLLLLQAVAGNHLAGAAPVIPPAHLEYERSDDDLEELDLVPTDAEATIMLLRNKLYPDPAQAAAAASAAKQSRHAKRSKAATGPSKATAAAITAAAAAAAAGKQLPPIVLKSQLYTVLSDKTAADRDLEDLRQKGRVRVFKLAIGEFTRLPIARPGRVAAGHAHKPNSCRTCQASIASWVTVLGLLARARCCLCKEHCTNREVVGLSSRILLTYALLCRVLQVLMSM